jgi:hypothetical protein
MALCFGLLALFREKLLGFKPVFVDSQTLDL